MATASVHNLVTSPIRNARAEAEHTAALDKIEADLQQMLRDLQGERERTGIHWGHVGDLTECHARLLEAARWIRQGRTFLPHGK